MLYEIANSENFCTISSVCFANSLIASDTGKWLLVAIKGALKNSGNNAKSERYPDTASTKYSACCINSSKSLYNRICHCIRPKRTTFFLVAAFLDGFL